jgi:ribose/xylose/arabinose/galactoside ABC-type transport system permease subunit
MLLRRVLFSEYFVLYLSAAYLVLGWAVIPGALSSDNLANIFSNLLPLLVVAIGETCVLIGAGIDLSVTSIIGLASIGGGLVMSADGGALAGSPCAAVAGVAVMLAVGLGLGAVNGLAITLLEMPPFMVTLTTMMGAGGVAIWLTRSRNLYHLPKAFDRIAEMPWPLAIVLAVAVAAHFVLERGLPGRWLYAVGHNLRAALASGVPVRGVIVASYAVSGLCAAIGSILYTARLETASPVLGQRLLLDVIAAVVIGGTSLFGGRGRVLWTVFGALLITVIDNSLSLLGLSNFMVLMVKGMVVLLAAILDAARRRALAV